jgi:hypothetical protein
MTDNRTPSDIRKEWTAALRSGEYKQGKKAMLCDDGSMCCLGVLHMVVTGKIPDIGQVLPHGKVADRAGLDFLDGRACQAIWKERSALTSANDAGATFAEIADIIDSNPPGMFIA